MGTGSGSGVEERPAAGKELEDPHPEALERMHMAHQSLVPAMKEAYHEMCASFLAQSVLMSLSALT